MHRFFLVAFLSGLILMFLLVGGIPMISLVSQTNLLFCEYDANDGNLHLFQKLNLIRVKSLMSIFIQFIAVLNHYLIENEVFLFLRIILFEKCFIKLFYLYQPFL